MSRFNSKIERYAKPVLEAYHKPPVEGKKSKELVIYVGSKDLSIIRRFAEDDQIKAVGGKYYVEWHFLGFRLIEVRQAEWFHVAWHSP